MYTRVLIGWDGDVEVEVEVEPEDAAGWKGVNWML